MYMFITCYVTVTYLYLLSIILNCQALQELDGRRDILQSDLILKF